MPTPVVVWMYLHHVHSSFFQTSAIMETPLSGHSNRCLLFVYFCFFFFWHEDFLMLPKIPKILEWVKEKNKASAKTTSKQLCLLFRDKWVHKQDWFSIISRLYWNILTLAKGMFDMCSCVSLQICIYAEKEDSHAHTNTYLFSSSLNMLHCYHL